MFTIKEDKRYFSETLKTAIANHDNDTVLDLIRDAEAGNLIDCTGATLLHLSAFHGNEGLTAHLIEAGVNINAQESSGMTPLMLAVTSQKCSIVKLLLQANANLFYPLEAVIAREHEVNLRIVFYFMKTLKHYGFDDEMLASILAGSGWPLYYAIIMGNPDVTRRMIDKGCDVNARTPDDGMTALHRAVGMGDHEHVRLLLERGADPNAKNRAGEAPLQNFALINQFPGILELLLRHGTELTDTCQEGTMQSCYIFKYGNARAVGLLLEHEADLAAADRRGDTALHYAASNCYEDVCRLFRGRAIEPSARNLLGETPLHAAMEHGNHDFARLLLDRGARLDERDDRGRTPLFASVLRTLRMPERERAIRLLIARGADVAAAAPEDEESLFGAALRCGNFEVLPPILRQLAKAEARGSRISETDLAILESDGRTRGYLEQCRVQLERMKGTTVRGSVTYFELLTGQPDSIVKYMRNRCLVRKLKRSRCGRKFPLYATELKERFSRGLREQRLMRNAIELLAEVIRARTRACDHDAAEKIASYLDLDDLLILAKFKRRFVGLDSGF